MEASSVADARRQSLRLAVGLALVAVGLVEIQSVLQAVRSQRRLRERVVGAVRQEALAALPQITGALAGGGPESWDRAAVLILASSLASEVEVFDESGHALLSRPTVSPVGHWPQPTEQQALRAGQSLAVAAQAGPALRVLTYVPFLEGEHRHLLRLSTAVPDLEDDLSERQRVVIGHMVALSILLLAGGLVLLPPGRDSDRPRPRVLDAYEQAMVQLRERGQEMSREHEVERRRMEEAIEDKEAMARAGELTAGIVHEMRNGLGTILGYARILERDTSPAVAEAGLRIREECETLETVARRFMDFVKRETLDRAPFDLGRTLSRVVAREFRHRPEVKTTLTGLEGGLTLMGDEELLERAFENLVRNAADAGGSGGRVWVEVVRDTQSVIVTVADDGPGMPSDRREIRPFFTSKAGGLGLGLPIALKIVRLHGGTLELGDRSPRGLSVTVRLPAEG
jgi:signal transduction histidine kinase